MKRRKLFLFFIIIIIISCAKRVYNPYDPIDKTAPFFPQVIINSGNEYTNNKEGKVNLLLKAKGAFKVKISNEAGKFPEEGIFFTGTKAHPDEMNINWVVSNPHIEGLKIVYAKFIDKAGNEVEAKDSIILDTIPPNFTCWIKINAQPEEEITEKDKDKKYVVKENTHIRFKIIGEEAGKANVYIGVKEYNYCKEVGGSPLKRLPNKDKGIEAYKYIFEQTLQIKIGGISYPYTYLYGEEYPIIFDSSISVANKPLVEVTYQYAVLPFPIIKEIGNNQYDAEYIIKKENFSPASTASEEYFINWQFSELWEGSNLAKKEWGKIVVE